MPAEFWYLRSYASSASSHLFSFSYQDSCAIKGARALEGVFGRKVFARADKHAYIRPKQLYSTMTDLTVWKVEVLHASCSSLRSCCRLTANKQSAYKGGSLGKPLK